MDPAAGSDQVLNYESVARARQVAERDAIMRDRYAAATRRLTALVRLGMGPKLAQRPVRIRPVWQERLAPTEDGAA
jgi:hypothetical protein